MSRRRRDTETSEGHLYIRVVSGAVTHGGLLTVDGQLPLESDHSRCSGLDHCCDKCRERSSTRNRRLPYVMVIAGKTRHKQSMKSGARVVHTAVEYDIVRKFLGPCRPRARDGRRQR
jgi:dissimilatory sulfite reductase (desulfoviridin) alpha/beta subunit